MDLALTEFGSALGKSGERFVVRRHGQPPVEVPAEDVDHIVIIGLGISVSTDALHLAAASGATVSVLEVSGRPVAELTAPEAGGKARLRRAQLRAGSDGTAAAGVELAKSFVRGKLRNQAANLRYFAKSRKESAPEIHEALYERVATIHEVLDELAALPADDLIARRGAMLNAEARAAKAYWEGVRLLLPEEVGFTARVRRGATDPFNAALNYGYGILYSRVWNVVVEVGLDPYAGFLHADRDNHPTLVFDVIEEFRQAAVDRPVLALFTKRWRPNFDSEGRLEPESRKELAARILEQFRSPVAYEGKSVSFEHMMKAQAYGIAAAIENGGAREPFVADW